VKKIKAKLSTTSLIAFCTVLLIISTVHSAEADPTTNAIYGGFDEGSIFIADNGINNIIILYDNMGNSSKHYDSIVKKYSSDGFTMRNPESGILVFAHSIEYDQYRLVIVTTDKVYRLIGVSQILSELEPSESGVIEPTSSVGADITYYDVPDELSRDPELSFLMTFKPLTFLDSMNLNDEFELMGYVYNVRDASRIDADLTLEISRDDYILKSLKTSTETFGTVNIEIDDMIYPLYYPNFCYEVKLTMEYGNYTAVWTEDFVMNHATGTIVWEPNMDWVIDARWNYLPQSFRDEPRQSIIEDERCN